MTNWLLQGNKWANLIVFIFHQLFCLKKKNSPKGLKITRMKTQVRVLQAPNWRLNRMIPSVSHRHARWMEENWRPEGSTSHPSHFLWMQSSRKQALDPKAGQRPPQCCGWMGLWPQTADRSYCCYRHSPPVGWRHLILSSSWTGC